jgi:hypothetical protein
LSKRIIDEGIVAGNLQKLIEISINYGLLILVQAVLFLVYLYRFSARRKIRHEPVKDV